jgi:integrase
MASVVDDPNGRRRILFVAPDEKRKTIRLGKIDRRTAESIARHVEALLAAKITGQPLPRETATWLAGVAPKLKDKLVAVGLIDAEKTLTVKPYLEDWLANRKVAGYAVASLLAWGQSVRELIAMFGERSLASLTHADGEAYRAAMQTRKLRSTTVHKRLGHARQMLEDAVRLSHITVNPWRHVRQRMGDVSERRAYVSVADVGRVIDHCPNVWWKLLVALARFGGLRIPSEAFSLTWGDVDWERNRLTVPSPKTRSHGKSHRVIPLFALLRPYLEAAFEHAEEGSEFILPAEYRQRADREGGWGGANLRTQFGKIVRRAGVDPWPRLWHSLRASCESDLAQSFPLATVTKWLGNTPSVALKHYVDPTEAAFDRAVNWMPAESGAKSGALEAQKAAQQVHAGNSGESQTGDENTTNTGTSATSCESLPAPAINCTNVQRECIGIEPTGSVVHTPHRF